MARISDNSSYQENQGFDLTAENDVLARLQQIRQSLNASLSGLEGTPSEAEASSDSDFSNATAPVSESASAAFPTSVSDFCDLDALDRFLSTCVTPDAFQQAAAISPRASQARVSRIPLPREISLCDVFADDPAELGEPMVNSASESSFPSRCPQTQPAPSVSASFSSRNVPQTVAQPSGMTSTAFSQTTSVATSSSNPFARFLPPTESESAVSPESQRQASVSSVAKWGQDFQYFAAGGIACGAVLLGLGYRDASSVMSVWQLGVSLLIAGSVSLLCSFACMATARPKRS